MSVNNKTIRCVMCNTTGWQMFVPSNDQTKTELNSLLDIYSHYVKKVIRGPSASYLHDFMHRDTRIFYSFCHSCKPKITRLFDLSSQTQKQIQIIRKITFVESNNDNNEHQNSNFPVPELNKKVQQQQQGTKLISRVFRDPTRTEPGQLKTTEVTDYRRQTQSSSSISTSPDTGYSDFSADSSSGILSAEVDEVLIVEKNSNAQNSNIPTVSIDCDDNNVEDNNQVVIKQMTFSSYLFMYKNASISFKRSDCFLKFNCSICSTQAQNDVGIITHVWTAHCEDGKVKVLPNYRIDVENSSASSSSSSTARQRSVVQEDGINITDPGRNSHRSGEVMREVVRVDQSSLLTCLSNGRVYYERDLEFYDIGGERFSCSYCLSTVPKHEILSHTTFCLPVKLRRTTRRKSPVRQRGRFDSPQPESYYSMPLQHKNGWPYYKINERKHKCGVSSCKFEDKTETELFRHLRHKHAGVFDHFRTCSVCRDPPFDGAEALWNHLYRTHRRNYI